MNLLYFILCSYGLTQILTSSKILDYFRSKHYFFSCPMCLGAWMGFLLWFVSPHTQLFVFDRNVLTGVLLGCLSSGTSYILCNLFGDKGIKYEHEYNDMD